MFSSRTGKGCILIKVQKFGKLIYHHYINPLSQQLNLLITCEVEHLYEKIQTTQVFLRQSTAATLWNCQMDSRVSCKVFTQE
eukprot:403347795